VAERENNMIFIRTAYDLLAGYRIVGDSVRYIDPVETKAQAKSPRLKRDLVRAIAPDL
jgi:hypothetical protein